MKLPQIFGRRRITASVVESTSPEVASIAARGLQHPEMLTLREIETVCASALTQAPDRKDR